MHDTHVNLRGMDTSSEVTYTCRTCVNHENVPKQDFERGTSTGQRVLGLEFVTSLGPLFTSLEIWTLFLLCIALMKPDRGFKLSGSLDALRENFYS
ncbi:hypothetical protein CsSME_00024481 [Camellia sinensis var. sinensis]